MKCIFFLSLFALVFPSFAEKLDFGDSKSTTLTVKAWEAMGADKLDDAATFANKCIELYEEEAVKMQAELKDFVADEGDDVRAKWALNDVGTCYFILGQVREKQKKPKEAVKAYETLSKKVKFAQCWDPNGWFWKPSKAAGERIAELKGGEKKAE